MPYDASLVARFDTAYGPLVAAVAEYERLGALGHLLTQRDATKQLDAKIVEQAREAYKALLMLDSQGLSAEINLLYALIKDHGGTTTDKHRSRNDEAGPPPRAPLVVSRKRTAQIVGVGLAALRPPPGPRRTGPRSLLLRLGPRRIEARSVSFSLKAPAASGSCSLTSRVSSRPFRFIYHPFAVDCTTSLAVLWGSEVGRIPANGEIARQAAALHARRAAGVRRAGARRPAGRARGQLGLGVVMWAVLLASLWPLPLERRVQTALVIAAATCMEVVGSILWGVYTYRLHNLPLFVPPGHGLIYLGGISLSESGLVRSRARPFLWAVTACAVAWALAGLTVLPRLDVAGALGVAVFLFFLWRGRAPAVYGGVFVVVAFLELWGTAIGLWQWHAITPGLGLPMGNPPSGAMSGYVLFDVVAIAVTARLLRGRRLARPAIAPAG